MEGVARNYLKCKKVLFRKQVANKNCYNNVFSNFKMPHSAINCKRLVSKCAWSFWRNTHESEAAYGNRWWSWIETTADFAKCTSRRTCKRNLKQDHASTVTEQREDLVFIHIHLIGPARGTSHRIMSAQLLNRHRISSSSISKEWTLGKLSKFF